MAVRTLRRKVLIREYDYARVKREAFNMVGVSALYDRAEFTPIKLDDLEKQRIVDYLKGKEEPLWRDLEMPATALYNVKDHLYDQRYFGWMVNYDEEGYLCVQARKNTPLSRIGWGVFEKDFSARI